MIVYNGYFKQTPQQFLFTSLRHKQTTTQRHPKFFSKKKPNKKHPVLLVVKLTHPLPTRLLPARPCGWAVRGRHHNDTRVAFESIHLGQDPWGIRWSVFFGGKWSDDSCLFCVFSAILIVIMFTYCLYFCCYQYGCYQLLLQFFSLFFNCLRLFVFRLYSIRIVGVFFFFFIYI